MEQMEKKKQQRHSRSVEVVVYVEEEGDDEMDA